MLSDDKIQKKSKNLKVYPFDIYILQVLYIPRF